MRVLRGRQFFCGTQSLDNLTVIVDYNRWQSFGRTKEVHY